MEFLIRYKWWLIGLAVLVILLWWFFSGDEEGEEIE